MGRFKGSFKESLKRKAQCLQSNRGFSLAEVLATVAILVILFALVAINVVNWQASIRQKEMDSKAQTIYVTAQEQMSTIVAAGQESLLQPLQNGGVQGNGVTRFEGVPADANSSEDNMVEENSIAYVTSDNLQTQMENPKSAVHALFYSGNLDEELLNNNWVIEYDYRNLTVYAVFYSEDSTNFNCATDYKPVEGNNYNSSYRDYSLRLKNTRGYVGYHSGAGSTGSNSYELNPTITVTNSEELTAQIKCTAPNLAASKLVFKVTIEDEFGHKYAKYYDFGNSYTSQDGLDANTAVYTSNSSSSLREQNGGAVPLKLGMIYELDLTLDSLAKDGLRFTNLYGTKSNHDNTANGNSNLTEGANLNISVEVFCPSNQQVKHGTATTSTSENKYPNNSLYGDQDGGTHINYTGTSVTIADRGTANISCGRHLQNLDVSSNVGTGVTKAYLGSGTVDFGNAKSADDNEWLSTYGNFDSSSSSGDASGSTQTSSTYFNGTDSNGLPLFKPIQNSSLVSLDGKSSTAAGDDTTYGVISGLNIDTAKDNDASATAAGLFATSDAASRSISNLRLSGSKVSGGNANAGVLVGQLDGNNSVNINNCQVYLQEQTDFTTGDKDAYKTVWVNGSAAGGLVGTVKGSASLTITRSSASTVIGDKELVASEDNNDVTSSVTAGGLVGSVEGGTVEVSASYADCYLYGKDVAGLIGTVNNAASVTIKNAYTAGFMAATNQTAGLVGGKVTAESAKCYTAISTLEKYNKAISNIGTTSDAADKQFMVATDKNAKTILSYLNDDTSREFTLDQSSQSSPYNLMGQALSSYEWPTVTDLHHYGDWVAGFEEGALVYYEKYQRGDKGSPYYGFYGANVDSTLDSRASDENSSIHVVGDGYGVVYRADQKPTSKITVTVTNPGNGTGSDAVSTVTIDPNTVTPYPVTSGGIEYVVYPLNKDVINTSTVNESGYYLKAQITHEVSGTTADPVYYAFNPHFAKTVKKLASQSDFPTIGDSPLVEVRTARQLWNLSKYYDSYFKITDSGIAKGKQITFSQGRNIDYEEYEWGTFSTLKSSQYSDGVTQTPIGSSASVPFKDIYNGNNYEITNVGFTSTPNEQLAGMFGCVGSTGQVKDTVLLVKYSPTSKHKYSVSYNFNSENLNNISLGVLAGMNQGKITNCAVSGYYIAGSKGTLHVYKNSKVNIGGLVGSNSGTIRNCSADTPKLDLSLQYASVNAGGFVGKNESGGKIQDSYAVGAIVVKESKESTVSMAGFAGKNESQISSSYCATALTASGTDTTLAAFAPKGGSVKSCYYLDGGTYSFIGKMYAYLFDATDTSGTRATYQTLKDKASSAGVTVANSLNHLNTTSAKDGLKIAYPFAGTVKGSSGSHVHYGDWPVEASMGSLGVFYWEKETGNNGGYHMTYLGTEFDDEDKLNPVKGTTLCTAHDDGGIITEYGYGYYEAKGQQDSVTADWSKITTSGDIENTTASLDLASQMNSESTASGSSYQYVFHAYTTRTADAAKTAQAAAAKKGETDNGDYIYLSGGSDVQNGSLTLSYKSASSSGTKTYEYGVSPFFGNAMSVVSVAGSPPSSGYYLVKDESGYQADFTNKEPGKSQTTLNGREVSAGNAYEVRSVDQLQYINWNGTAGNASTLVSKSNYKNFNYLPYANSTDKGSKGKNIVDRNIRSSRVERFWTQTHDVEPSEDTNFTPIAGTLESSTSTSYNAVMYAWFGATYNGQSYTVKNLDISTTSFNVGLFGTTVGASLSNIIMYGDTSADAAVKRTAGSDVGAYSIGGLVGVAYDYDTENPSTIQNCAISGYTIDDSSDNKLGLGEVNIGGLIGVSNTNLTKCSAVTNIKLEQNLFEKKNAEWGIFVRVGGLTGATQATVSNCYSGGSCSISDEMLSNTVTYNKDLGGGEESQYYDVYIGGIAGSGFTSNYMNFTNQAKILDGSPTVENSYTYFEFPSCQWQQTIDNQKLRIFSFAIASISDRIANVDSSDCKATITNSYYLGSLADGKPNFTTVLNKKLDYNGSQKADKPGCTVGTPTALTYDQMAGNATVGGSSFKDALGTSWGTVTTEDNNGVNIDGKYSFPSSSVLEGKNYPFPTVITQNDLTFGTYAEPVNVNVHYGDWPINGSHWANGRDSVDIFADMDASTSSTDDPWTYKEATLSLKGNDITAMDNAIASGRIAGLFTFNNGQGSNYTAYSDLVDVYKVEEAPGATSSDGYATYNVKFKVKQDGVVNVRFNGSELATFTLQITADLEVSAALNSGDVPDVFNTDTNTLKLALNNSKTLKLISKSSHALTDGSYKDYSVRTTWSDVPVVDPEGAAGCDYSNTNINSVQTTMSVRRDMTVASTVTTTASYAYHTNEGGKTYTKDLVITVTGPDVVGLSNGTTYNEAPTVATGDALNGKDISYDAQDSKPSYDLDSITSNMFLYSSASSDYLSRLGNGLTIDDITIDDVSGYKNGEYDKDKRYYINIAGDVTTDAGSGFSYLSGLLSYNGSDTDKPAGAVEVKLTFSDGHVLQASIPSANIPKLTAATLSFKAGDNNIAQPQTATEAQPVGATYIMEKPSVRFSDTAVDKKSTLDAAFDYWKLDGSDTHYYAGKSTYKVTEDATFTAVWKKKLSFRVAGKSVADAYISADGGSLTDLGDALIKAGNKAKTSKNWMFAGWYDSTGNDATQIFDADGKLVTQSYDGTALDIDADGKVTLNADAILYAKWYRWEQASSLKGGQQYVFASSVTAGDAKIFGAGSGTFNGYYQNRDNNNASYIGIDAYDVYVTKRDNNANARILANVDDSCIWTASSSNNSFVLKVGDKCLSYSSYSGKSRYGWWNSDTRVGLVADTNGNSYFAVYYGKLYNTRGSYIKYDASGSDTVLFTTDSYFSSNDNVYIYGKAFTDDPGDIIVSGQYLIAAPNGNSYRLLSAAASGDSNSEAVDYDVVTQTAIANKQIWTFSPKDDDANKFTVTFANDNNQTQYLDLGATTGLNTTNIVKYGEDNGTYWELESKGDGSNQFYVAAYDDSNDKLKGYLVYDRTNDWSWTTDKTKATSLCLIQYTGK